MSDQKVNAFVRYALTGFYAKHRKPGDPKLWTIKKTALQKIWGNKSRIGSAQREQLQQSCIVENIGMAELSDRFVFFAPDDVEPHYFDMTPAAKELKSETEHFAKLRRGEADRDWNERYQRYEGEE